MKYIRTKDGVLPYYEDSKTGKLTVVMKNTIYFEDKTTFEFYDLPEGYFYKNHFYRKNTCFKELLKDGVVYKHPFPNGTWRYKDTLYSSLKDLFEWNEDEIAEVMPYNKLKKHYEELDIEFDNQSCVRYSYEDDCYNQLYDSIGECLMEMRNETNIIEDEEDREDRYIENLSKEETINYLGKSIKERIKILEEHLK